MIQTLQITYFALFTLKEKDPLIDQLKYLGYTNGVIAIDTISPSNFPSRISSNGFTGSMLNDSTIIVFLPLAIVIIGIVFYFIPIFINSLREKMLKY